MTRRLATALSLALALAGASPARADFQSFVDAFCGTSCADPIGEQAAARENWSALQTMGTTEWIGTQLGGKTVDAGSLLGASRVAGASERNRWLTTGEASSPQVAQAMSSALGAGSGLDVGLITGLAGGGKSTSLDSTLGGALGSALGTATGGGGGGYCDPKIDQAQNANAQKYVNSMQQIATSGDYGFSQNGGQPVSSGQASGSGYFQGGCLEGLMQGTRDMLFKPPGLSSLLSQLGGMFGGGGGGGGGAAGCGNAPSVMSQIQKSMPQSIFSAGNGGFLPAQAFGGGSLMSASGLANLGASQMRSGPANLSALLGR